MIISMENIRPIVLAILDGWGFSKKKVGNPIASANKPTIDMLSQNYPMTLLQASGLAVGMTWGESGNSEVGHLNIGAGRIVEQYLSRITRAIQDRSFFQNEALTGAFDYAIQKNSRIHIVGLLTSGTAHADFPHIIALLELARQKNCQQIYLHLFLDGKDSGLQEAPILLTKLQVEMKSNGCGKIATLIGRNFAMDRDNNWKFTNEAYELLANAKGETSTDPIKTIQDNYGLGLSDSTMTAIVAADSGFEGIKENDAVIFFNFREDSMRQILKPFVEENFSLFPVKNLKNTYIATMTQYLEGTSAKAAFMPPTVTNSLAEVLEANGKKQLHVAETEKYAHVTYFFNGLRTKESADEIDIFVESNKDHESEPAMKSAEIAQKVVEELDKNLHDFIVLNFANADMLAHTGNLAATVKGIEAVDSALGSIIERVLAKEGIVIVTADHGNAESLVYRSSGEAETRHDDSPVPFYLVGRQYQIAKTSERMAQETADVSGILGDVAPTVLELMGLQQPPEMTGKSLLGILTGQNS